MNYAKIQAAEKEAKRFLERIADWRADAKSLDKCFTHTDLDSIYNFGTKRSAAIKRASLDLSRSLSELRKA